MRSLFNSALINKLILRTTLRAGRIGAFATRHRAALQIGAGTVALTAGFAGWMIENRPTDIWGVWDNLLRTFQLITLQFPHDLGATPNLLLQFARLAVPAVALLASFQVLIASLTRPARLALLPYTSGHIIICGSGKMTQKALAALAAREQQVVVVGSNISNVASLEGLGLTVLDAAPHDTATLTVLHLPRATALFVLGDNDLENLNIATRAIALTEGRPSSSNRLILAVRIDREDLGHEFDFALDSLSRRYGIRYDRISPAREAIRLEFLSRAPDFVTKGRLNHVLIVGLLAEWQQIAMQVVTWMQNHPTESPTLTFMLDPREISELDRWLNGRPELTLIVHVEVLRRDTGSLLPAESTCSQWHQKFGDPHWIIILRDDSQAISTALALRRAPWMKDRKATSILVHQSKEDHILQGMRSLTAERYDFSNIVAIGGLLRAESVERVLDHRGDEIAMALHAHYLARSQGGPISSEAAQKEWDDLPENLREANRAAVDHASILLGAIGCAATHQAAPSTGYAPTDSEWEILAKIEHRRWMADRIERGWRFGSLRNDDHQVHPDLVSYEELPESARQKDRMAVRTLIEVLKERGATIEKIRDDLPSALDASFQ